MTHTPAHQRTGADKLPVRIHDFSECPLRAFYHDQTALEMHTHDCIEFVYVVRGYGEHRHMNHHYPIHMGDCFVIDTGEAHAYEKSKGLRIVNILFPTDFLVHHLPILKRINGFNSLFSVEPLFRAETSFRYKLHLSAADRLIMEPLVDALVDEYLGKRNGYAAACSGLFLQIVTCASRAFVSNSSAMVRSDFSGKEEAVAQAMSFLESHHERAISVDDVADSVCLSGSRLSHVFKDVTGMSLMDYLLRYRLERARVLLRDRAQTVTQVAYAVGFHDPGYFSRAFRKHFGCSPRQIVTKGPKA